MAVEWSLDEEEEDKNKDLSSGSVQEVGGAPAMISGAEQPSDNPGTSSGSYTNLQKYIEANKGRDFGGQVAQSIDQNTSEGLKQLGERESQFKSSVDQGVTSGLSDDLKGKIQASPESLSDEDRNTAYGVRGAQYKGPEPDAFLGGADDSDPYAQLRKYFGGIEEKAKATQSTGSSKTLLKKMYSRPTYTEGEVALDSYLLGGQRAPVEAAHGRATDALNQYEQKKTDLGGYVQSAKDKTKDAKSQYRQLLGLDTETGSAIPFEQGKGQQGLIQKELDSLYGKAAARKAEQEAVTKDPYAHLGIERNDLGIDPSRYYKGLKDINYQNVATPEDLARLKALTDLAGVDQNYLDPSQVGTLDTEPLIDFDKDAYYRDVLDREHRKKIGDRSWIDGYYNGMWGKS